MSVELTSLKLSELLSICKDRKIKGYSGKKKGDLITLIEHHVEPGKPDECDRPEQKATYKLRMVDLFAGTGAFSYAFKSTGKVEVVYSNDMVEPARKIYNLNFNHSLTLGDLNNVDVECIGNHDILSGGFPCQPFSIAGYREGFDDERSNVFWKILEIIDRYKPQCILLENVKNLVTHDSGKTFKTILENLERRSYYVKHKVLNTAKITGIPQHRERIYIVCFRSKEAYDNFSMDFEVKPKRPLSDILIQEKVDDKYYYTEKSSTWDLVSSNVVKKNTIYQYRRVYVRENKSNECPTLTANMGTGGHNVPIILDDFGIRKLTPRECFNFQGFPSDYKLPQISDSSLYKLVGNAVSLPVVQLLASRITQLVA